MSDYNNFDGLNNRENETENLSEEKNEYKASESESTYSSEEQSAEEILKDVEFAEEETASAADDSKGTDASDEYKTTDYSASSSYSNTNSYTTTSGNNGGTASYEWNNGQYSGKYTAGSYSNNNNSGSYSSSSYSSGNYRYGSQPYNSYSSNTNNSYNNNNGTNGTYGQNSSGAYGYGNNQNYNQQQAGYYNNSYVNPAGKKKKAPKAKKEKKTVRVSALVLTVSLLASAVLGFGGGMVANYVNGGGSGGNGMTINKVVTTAEETNSTTGEMSTSDIVAATKNSVVEITTEIVKTGSFLQQYIESGAGSGVIISENGYIVTNNHVIEDASSITVTLADGTSYSAKLVGTDADLDVALIKIDATGLDPAEIGDSSATQAGNKAVVIGNPLGQLGGSVTQGIVSSVSRNVMIDGVSHNVMQVDASINPGNSGGGLFNGRGELVGIIIAKSVNESVEGIGFAIPINDVSDILEDLMNYGYVRGKVSLGMSFVDITNAQTAMMYRVSELGCYVSSVEINSNAANAGFQSGDRITSVNGTSVSTSSDIKTEISKMAVGDTVEFTVERNGRTGTLSLVLEEAVPEGIAAQNESGNESDGSNGSNGIRDSLGNDYNPYDSTGSADDYYYYFFN